MQEQLSALLQKAGVNANTMATFMDAYSLGFWKGDAEREEWAENFCKLVESMLAKKPQDEVKRFLELQAVRMDAVVVGNPAAHTKAIEDLKNFLKTHTA